MKIITIERQYASGGREIGKLLAERLSIPYYDGELLYLAAEKAGLNPGVLRDLDERPTRSFLYNVAVLYDNIAGSDHAMYPYKAFQAETETIRHLAHEGPCVFIGRCAGVVLGEQVRQVRAFIYASDMEQRIRRAMEVDGVPAKAAPGYIARKDKQRRDYFRSYTERNWDDWEQYDLCLNSSTLGYEGCAAVLAALAQGRDY